MNKGKYSNVQVLFSAKQGFVHLFMWRRFSTKMKLWAKNRGPKLHLVMLGLETETEM